MADFNESMEGAFTELGGQARVEDAVKIRGEVKIINKEQIKALVEKFINQFGTNPELEAKITGLEQELAAAKEQITGAGSDKDSLRSQLDELNRQFEALKAEKAELEQKIATMEADDLFMRMKAIEAERDQLIQEKEESLAKLIHEKEILEEKIRKLEEIVAANDLQNRVKDLEYELIELREAYRQATLGLEFIDLVEEVDYGKLLEQAQAVSATIAQVEPTAGEAGKPHLENIKKRLAWMTALIKSDPATFQGLVDTMNDNKGAINIIVEIIKIALRGKSFREELEMAAAALAVK